VSLAIPLELRDGDRDRLADLARLPSVPSGLAKRARMVLLAADGVPNAQIARLVGVSRPTVIGWRDRYSQGGIKALEDESRPGRPPRIDEVTVVVTTLAGGGRPPQRLGLECWSARCLAAELGISFASVARIWRKWGIDPRRTGEFTFATDPGLEANIREVVGLYLGPPALAVMVSVDRTFQSHTDRAVPARRGVPEWRTRDHMRYGTTALFAALKTAGVKPAGHQARPRHQEFLRFLRQAAAANPGVDLHVVVDSQGTRGTAEVRRWLAQARSRRISVHVTPAGCPWLTMVEILLGLVTHRAARRGAIRSAAELTAAIGTFIEAYDNRRQAFTWIKNASESPGLFRT
jgi:transposase